MHEIYTCMKNVQIHHCVLPCHSLHKNESQRAAKLGFSLSFGPAFSLMLVLKHFINVYTNKCSYSNDVKYNSREIFNQY